MLLNRAGAALILAAVAAVACGGGRPQGALAPAASAAATAPARLVWTAGSSFRASVEQRVTQTVALEGAAGAPPATDLQVTTELALTVAAVRDGVADLGVRTVSWRWGRAGNPQPADVGPPPAHLGIGPDGTIRSGRCWAMPLDPPLPGLDFFAAALPAGGTPVDAWSTSWTRTLEDDSRLDYRTEGRRVGGPSGRTVVETTSSYRLTRRLFTPDHLPDVLSGSARAVVRSELDLRLGRVLSTSYTSSFTSREVLPQGAVGTEGSVVTTIRFDY